MLISLRKIKFLFP